MIVQELYETAADPAEQARALYAIAHTPEVLNALEYAASGKVTSNTSVEYCFTSILGALK
jgi:hypothetical protein